MTTAVDKKTTARPGTVARRPFRSSLSGPRVGDGPGGWLRRTGWPRRTALEDGRTPSPIRRAQRRPDTTDEDLPTMPDDDPHRPDSGHHVAAFFDLDKTILARSSTLAFSRPFYNGG